MPNIKSAKKRVLVSKVNNERNKMDKSILKTTLKKFDAAVAEGNHEQADSAYKAAVKTIDQAVCNRNYSQRITPPAKKERHYPETEQNGLQFLVRA